MNKEELDRIEELEEMHQEFVLNESWIPEEQSPSWGDVAEACAIAESLWEETPEGKELKLLLALKPAPLEDSPNP